MSFFDSNINPDVRKKVYDFDSNHQEDEDDLLNKDIDGIACFEAMTMKYHELVAVNADAEATITSLVVDEVDKLSKDKSFDESGRAVCYTTS
ncbi:uncharacterized protein L203_101907 [Cryptococcus depauperatus CBS 7841]|uniref:Uncharacterized protein n=1 Tax=Cryptococcus depauperatus CBS 7841 TaxID=1295531 RepID=A0AAJ8JQP3_9TREE